MVVPSKDSLLFITKFVIATALLLVVFVPSIFAADKCQDQKNALDKKLNPALSTTTQKLKIGTSKGNMYLDYKVAESSDQLKGLLLSTGFKLDPSSKFIVSDIDNTWIKVKGSDGNTNMLGVKTNSLSEFNSIINKNQQNILFGVATGRNVDMAIAPAYEHNTAVKIVIARVGTEIFFLDHKNKAVYEYRPWFEHLKSFGHGTWNGTNIKKIMEENFPDLEIQAANVNSDYKVSYFLYPDSPYTVEQIKSALEKNGQLDTRIVYSASKFLDILPSAAGKGNCIAFMMKELGIPADRVITADDSGNGIDMLTLSVDGASVKGVVPSNYSKEMENLKTNSGVYFSPRGFSGAITDAIKKYGWSPNKPK